MSSKLMKHYLFQIFNFAGCFVCIFLIVISHYHHHYVLKPLRIIFGLNMVHALVLLILLLCHFVELKKALVARELCIEFVLMLVYFGMGLYIAIALNKYAPISAVFIDYLLEPKFDVFFYVMVSTYLLFFFLRLGVLAKDIPTY